MEEQRQSVGHARSTIGLLGGTCSVLAVLVLAGGLVMFGNYRKMKDMEAVIASVMPSAVKSSGLRSFAGQSGDGELEVESVPGEVYPTLADIVIDQESGDGADAAGNSTAGSEAGADVDGSGTGSAVGASGTGSAGAGVAAEPGWKRNSQRSRKRNRQCSRSRGANMRKQLLPKSARPTAETQVRPRMRLLRQQWCRFRPML